MSQSGRSGPLRGTSGGGAELGLHTLYGDAFFRRQRDRVWQSARVVAPLVLEIIAPNSVVDVGCGTGVWLSVFKEHGVRTILGIDGPHVPREQLEIGASEFRPIDLARPASIARTFDLVVSLEVAEHLPKAHAEDFVAFLASLGPAILFSAAIPFQGGHHHINEQWPDFWARLFEEHRYLIFDVLRDDVWTDDRVEWWYAQNMLLFVRQALVRDYRKLDVTKAVNKLEQLRRVHPRKHLQAAEWTAQIYRTLDLIAAHVPVGCTLLLADGGSFGPIGLRARQSLAFPPEDRGCCPADDYSAIDDLERMRSSGAKYFALTNQAFWWLDHYQIFTRHIDKNYARVAQSDAVIIYDLYKCPCEPIDTRRLNS